MSENSLREILEEFRRKTFKPKGMAIYDKADINQALKSIQELVCDEKEMIKIIMDFLSSDLTIARIKGHQYRERAEDLAHAIAQELRERLK